MKAICSVCGSSGEIPEVRCSRASHFDAVSFKQNSGRWRPYPVSWISSTARQDHSLP